MAAYEEIAAAHGPEIAAVVARRFAAVVAEGSPGMVRYLDGLPDYFARQAVWRREFDRSNAQRAATSPTAAKARTRKPKPAATTTEAPFSDKTSPRARVSPDQVRAIRRRRAAGETSLALAAEFGLTKRNINLIVSRQRWAHVAD
ncbi:MAG: hypothetical protein Q7V15_02115 [Phenylobacterium sp.]|uniref:hypothetical protein n=1 Tax=Phenylobacterium sp. TaxID=1871053 RepID=UPI00271AE821|nr:hypothetical protein [Phenylobacterium sp.]MDO8900129.1 hypothetical protein [Phenylobacterium sp.]